MTMPNFVVIGAAKCGTDSLCAYLDQHPDVYVSPNREPNFFIVEGQQDIPYRGPGDRETLQGWDGWVSTMRRYEELFAGVTTEKAIGEGSTWYIYDEHAPQGIRRHVPRAKLIAVLRNPVDRAYSAFTMLARDGRETTTNFAEALAAEDVRVRANWEPLWHYRRMGLYSEQLRRYFGLFDPAQLRVVIYDDFNTRPGEVLRELFEFLEVDPTFVPDVSQRRNVSYVPKNATYNRLIAGQNPLKAAVKAVLPVGLRRRVKDSLQSSNLTAPTPLAPEIRQQLMDVFRSDILQVQDLLHRDLSHWLR
jgi:hypothetical protein